MSNPDISKFVQAVTRDETLQEKLRGAVAAASGGSAQEAIAGVAREQGYNITAEELSEAGVAEALTELDLKQLDSVAGGYYSSQNPNSPFGD